MKRPGTLKQFTGLNPRFDGAFLNFKIGRLTMLISSLNPRFDGAFLNCGIRVAKAVLAWS